MGLDGDEAGKPGPPRRIHPVNPGDRRQGAGAEEAQKGPLEWISSPRITPRPLRFIV
jgi:hypothetical protein